jgi:hypothetical protein
MRRCGEEALRMFVTGGGGIPQRIVIISVPLSVLRTTGQGSPGKCRASVASCRHSDDHTKQSDDCSPVRGDAVEAMPMSA